MQKTFEGVLDGRRKSFAIVVSRFNEAISLRLLEGALDCLRRHNTEESRVDVAWVPGSFEIPVAAQKVAAMGRYDAVICLGALVRGATPHFDYIASEAAKGVSKVSLDSGVPCIFGIITADSLEQAIERAGTKQGNKGRDAAISAVELANLFDNL